MKCQNCKVNEATAFFKQNINGKVTEMHLCSECASKMGYSAFTAFTDPFELFSSVFAPQKRISSNAKKCKTCGITFDEIVKTGRVGCPECYTEFYDELMPSIRKIHGNSKHMGRVQVKSEEQKEEAAEKGETAEEKITRLKAEMQKAIDEQNFEEAAKLRDEIKETEEER